VWTVPGGATPLGCYLASRVVELVVHPDDLAVSVNLREVTPQRSAASIVIGVFVEMARHRSGDLDVIRAPARAERADAARCAFSSRLPVDSVRRFGSQAIEYELTEPSERSGSGESGILDERNEVAQRTQVLEGPVVGSVVVLPVCGIECVVGDHRGDLGKVSDSMPDTAQGSDLGEVRGPLEVGDHDRGRASPEVGSAQLAVGS